MAVGGGEGQGTGGHVATPVVFLSYASSDAVIATSIVEHLEQRGIRCWLAPRDVRPGAQYADAIVRAINEANAVVLVLSGSAMASSHVAREIERAASKRKPIIAFRTDAAALSPELEYFLSNSQWIDVLKLGMPASLAKVTEAASSTPTNATDHYVPANLDGKTRRLAISAAAVIGVGVVASLGLHFWSSSHSGNKSPAVRASGPAASTPASVPISDKSIAVLPFVDMSEKKNEEYFSDGLSEELIDKLTSVPELRVPARTSSFYFKGKQVTVGEIAKQLGVTHVLEGSVRRSGDQLRITAQLVRADNGYHVWSETYDRKIGDIFKIQDEIASAVVNQLQASLLSGTVPVKPPTTNSEAYTLYLQAKSLFQNATPTDYQRAYDCLQRALALDPSFALAWSEVAWVRVRQYFLGLVPKAQAVAEAHRALAKALEINSSLAEAHLTKGRVLYVIDWDWPQAEHEIRQAIALDPGISDGYRWAGMVAGTLGHSNEALELYRKAAERDPLEAHAYYLMAEIQLRRGNWSDAVSNSSRAHVLMPTMYGDSVPWIDLARGDYEAALAWLPHIKSTTYANIVRARAFYALHRKAEADAALIALERDAGDSVPFEIAMIHANRSEIDETFSWLDRAYEVRDIDLANMLGHPDLRRITGDPRYKVFLRKMRLPD